MLQPRTFSVEQITTLQKQKLKVSKTSRYTGKTPAQAAKKVFTTYKKTTKCHKLHIYIRETTRGRKKNIFHYLVQRVKKNTPIIRFKGQPNEFTVKYEIQIKSLGIISIPDKKQQGGNSFTGVRAAAKFKRKLADDYFNDEDFHDVQEEEPIVQLHNILKNVKNLQDFKKGQTKKEGKQFINTCFGAIANILVDNYYREIMILQNSGLKKEQQIPFLLSFIADELFKQLLINRVSRSIVDGQIKKNIKKHKKGGRCKTPKTPAVLPSVASEDYTAFLDNILNTEKYERLAQISIDNVRPSLCRIQPNLIIRNELEISLLSPILESYVCNLVMNDELRKYDVRLRAHQNRENIDEEMRRETNKALKITSSPQENKDEPSGLPGLSREEHQNHVLKDIRKFTTEFLTTKWSCYNEFQNELGSKDTERGQSLVQQTRTINTENRKRLLKFITTSLWSLFTFATYNAQTFPADTLNILLQVIILMGCWSANNVKMKLFQGIISVFMIAMFWFDKIHPGATSSDGENTKLSFDYIFDELVPEISNFLCETARDSLISLSSVSGYAYDNPAAVFMSSIVLGLAYGWNIGHIQPSRWPTKLFRKLRRWRQGGGKNQKGGGWLEFSPQNLIWNGASTVFDSIWLGLSHVYVGTIDKAGKPVIGLTMFYWMYADGMTMLEYNANYNRLLSERDLYIKSQLDKCRIDCSELDEAIFNKWPPADSGKKLDDAVRRSRDQHKNNIAKNQNVHNVHAAITGRMNADANQQNAQTNKEQLGISKEQLAVAKEQLAVATGNRKLSNKQNIDLESLRKSFNQIIKDDPEVVDGLQTGVAAIGVEGLTTANTVAQGVVKTNASSHITTNENMVTIGEQLGLPIAPRASTQELYKLLLLAKPPHESRSVGERVAMRNPDGFGD